PFFRWVSKLPRSDRYRPEPAGPRYRWHRYPGFQTVLPPDRRPYVWCYLSANTASGRCERDPGHRLPGCRMNCRHHKPSAVRPWPAPAKIEPAKRYSVYAFQDSFIVVPLFKTSEPLVTAPMNDMLYYNFSV